MTTQNQFIDQKKSFIFFVIILGSLISIGPLAIDMYLPAFSSMAQYFAVDEAKIQLTLSSYFIGIALGQIFYGPIVDRFGKKPPLIIGLIIFVISSIFCLIATNINQIIIWRLIQAIGACGCFVVCRAIVRDLFSVQESARVFSYLILVMGTAPIVAPLLGGLVLKHFDWQAIFWFLTIFSILLTIIAYFYLPESNKGDKNEKLRYGIRKYLGILKDKNFISYSLSGGFAASGMFVYITGSPFIMIKIFGISEQNYGWIFGLNAFGYVLFAQINGKLLKLFSIKKVLDISFKILLLSSIMLIVVSIYFYSLITISIAIFIYIALIGIITPNCTAISLANQPTHSGSASALFGTLQFSIAALTSFLLSKIQGDNAVALCLMIAFCGIAAFLVNFFKTPILNNNTSN